MMMPRIFGKNIFDEFFDDGFFNRNDSFFGNRMTDMMKTDIKETDDTYQLDMDLPGFKKEDITAQLKDGYLTISAMKSTEDSKEDNDGKYIRKERYEGRCSRSFYVGEGVTQEEINAKFEDGILKLTVPKRQADEIKQEKYISIEG